MQTQGNTRVNYLNGNGNARKYTCELPQRKCKRKERRVWTASAEMQTQGNTRVNYLNRNGNARKYARNSNLFFISCVCICACVFISHVWTGETQMQTQGKKTKQKTNGFILVRHLGRRTWIAPAFLTSLAFALDEWTSFEFALASYVWTRLYWSDYSKSHG